MMSAGTPCGICDGRRRRANTGGRWMDINTDRMTMRSVYDLAADAEESARASDGVPAHAEDHLDAISAGFTATYRFLHRATVGAA